MSHLKLTLAGLPDRAITEEMLVAIAKPFLIEVEKVHSTVLKKVWTDVILPCVVTLIILTFVGILCWLVKRGQLYIMRACIQRLLRRGDEDEPEEQRLSRIADELQQPSASSRTDGNAKTPDLPQGEKKPRSK